MSRRRRREPSTAQGTGSVSRIAEPDGLPRVAAVTMVRDEACMLPRWLAHYAAQLGGTRHLYVIDDNSTDGSTDDLPCSVLRLPPTTKKMFEPARMAITSGLAATLLEAYEAVIFVDADEFLVADPARHENLRAFLGARADAEVIGAVALNVVHLVGSEPPLDPGRPVLEQRSLAKFVPLMCKPAVKRVPAAWGAASHAIAAPFTLDPDLWMFHLKFADRDHLRAAADHRRAMVEHDGRAADTSWSRGGEDMVAILEGIAANADLSKVKEFVPPADKLPQLVKRQDSGMWRSTGARQVLAMEKRPLVRIPDRFRGVF